MSKINRSRLSVAIGTGFSIALASSPVAIAAQNPFSMTELHSGYKVADNQMGEAKCGANKAAQEAQCGANKKQKAEAKCGANKGKVEAKCGANKKSKAEAKCGASKASGDTAMKKTVTEGKCGSGRR